MGLADAQSKLRRIYETGSGVPMGLADAQSKLRRIYETGSGVPKRKARGFRSPDNLIAMLYFTAAKLRIPATH